MAKIRMRVALIHQQPREPDDDGGEQFRTLIKLIPEPGYGNGGEVTLGFGKADVKTHTGSALFDRDGHKTRTMIEPGMLITEAIVYVKGEKAATFKASVPGFACPPEARASGFGWPDVEERAGGVYELDFTEVV